MKSVLTSPIDHVGLALYLARMESHMDHALALEALMMQLAEGVDEWILDAPVTRFIDPESVRFAHQDTKHAQKIAPKVADAREKPAEIQVNFEDCIDIPAVLDALKAVLPPALIRSALNDLEILGDEDADIAIIIDPPHQMADQQGDLAADPAIKLLLKSFAAIDLGLNADGGKEPRARIAILPISPWRVAQDRKLMEGEAEIFRDALQARLLHRQFKALVLAGNNIAGIERHLFDDQYAGIDVYSVVSSAMMLREPLLKRRHWQMLLALNGKLDEILKI